MCCGKAGSQAGREESSSRYLHAIDDGRGLLIPMAAGFLGFCSDRKQHDVSEERLCLVGALEESCENDVVAIRSSLRKMWGCADLMGGVEVYFSLLGGRRLPKSAKVERAKQHWLIRAKVRW